MSKDKYRPLFCNSNFYQRHQTTFSLWKNQFYSFSPTEKIKAWTIALSCLRRPHDWFGGARSNPFQPHQSAHALKIKVKDLFVKTTIKWSQKIDPDIDIQQFLQTCRIKPLPESALRSLYRLGTTNDPILITTIEPTPFELLKIQINGQRVITFDDNFELWPSKIYGERDPLSFIIHDLIHADHFLNNQEKYFSQIGFYKFIEKIKSHTELKNLMNRTDFKTGFEYIISDMNAHPVHLFQTLKAFLFLTLSDDTSALKIWDQWIYLWNINPEHRDAVQKINTQLFSNIHANHIEIMCFNESQKLA